MEKMAETSRVSYALLKKIFQTHIIHDPHCISCYKENSYVIESKIRDGRAVLHSGYALLEGLVPQTSDLGWEELGFITHIFTSGVRFVEVCN